MCFNHGSPRSICVVAIVSLFTVFSIHLQISPSKCPRATFSTTSLYNIRSATMCVSDAEWPSSQLKRTVKHGMIRDASRNRSMCKPQPRVQSSKYRRPATPKNVPTRWKFLEGISRDILGVHVKEIGFVPLAVCVKNQSPRMRAPQPRVARDLRNIRPAPPCKVQTHVIKGVRQNGKKSGKEVPQTRVDTIRRGTFKCCDPTATIYLRDQDYRGHVKTVRPRPSYWVCQKHDRSRDGWNRYNQEWFTSTIKNVPERRKYLEGSIRWED